MNAWHLVWIVPLSALIGLVVEAILVAGDDDKK